MKIGFMKGEANNLILSVPITNIMKCNSKIQSIDLSPPSAFRLNSTSSMTSAGTQSDGEKLTW